MNLSQRKLNKSEWNSVEISVSNTEKEIINMIEKGYDNLNYTYNATKSLMYLLKIPYTETNEKYIYNSYIKDKIEKIKKKYNITYDKIISFDKKKINKVNILKIENNSKDVLNKDISTIYEFQLLEFVNKLLKLYNNKNYKWCVYYYTICTIIQYDIYNVNKFCIDFIEYILNSYENDIERMAIIAKGKEFIEGNEYLLRFSPNKLYSHQREIFSIFKHDNDNNDFIKEKKKNIKETSDYIQSLYKEKNTLAEELEYYENEDNNDYIENIKNDIEKINDDLIIENEILENMESELNEYFGSKLVLYTAPTATGKTLTPIALSNQYRVIFVCAARHVGVALAKSAISVGKKIAFAFGCDTADDIRLHYFAASKYIKHSKTGQEIKYKNGAKKVDNSEGDKVEIMICDIKSYLCAMYYMISFNNQLNKTNNDIICFWDEPTITLDYDTHECHEYISKNWKENLIPNVILSSATLPETEDISNTIQSFRDNFPNSHVHRINSSECKKSLQIINSNGKVELPHLYFKNFTTLKKSVDFCLNYKTLYRYFDLNEICKFICLIYEDDKYEFEEHLTVNNYFTDIKSINMENIKEYYLRILQSIESEELWDYLYNKYSNYDITTIPKNTKFKSSGINITTSDAFTLTDGPTIYIAENVEKIAKFCIQQLKIPSQITEQLNSDINFNNNINKEIMKVNEALEDTEKGDIEAGNEKKLSRESNKERPNVKLLRKKLDDLNSLYKTISLDPIYIVNSLSHLTKWYNSDIANAFTSKLDPSDVQRIMEVPNINDIWRVLLLIGIGLFSKDQPIEYTEIVKEFADNQKLYLIIANGDYIYGTNYQFCHSYIGKDLEDITQEKIIQAMGRVGRNKLQQTYSIRIRDDSMIDKIFLKEEDKKEAKNMNILFS